jgi:hypothetical protein
VVVIAALGVVPANADSPAYLVSIEQAQRILAVSNGGTPAQQLTAAQNANLVLRESIGINQSEILDDLTATPPDIADAQTRLAALVKSLRDQANTDNPKADQAKLQSILSQPRYAPPTDLLGQFWRWLLTQIENLLSTLNLNLHLGRLSVVLAEILIGAAIIGVLALMAWIIVRGRPNRNRTPDPAGRVINQTARTFAEDNFAEAERLAAAGDLSGALRALAHAVATELSGRPYWDSSPLTVRELFRETSRLDQLRPLLLPFERAVYGHQAPEAATYAEAARVAGSFRARPS